MRVRRHLILAAAAAFTGEQHLLRTTVRCRGTFRDAQHELMDGGAAIELAGDALRGLPKSCAAGPAAPAPEPAPPEAPPARPPGIWAAPQPEAPQ